MSQDTPGKTGSDAFSAALAAELEVESQIDKIDWETGQLATQRRQATAEGANTMLVSRSSKSKS